MLRVKRLIGIAPDDQRATEIRMFGDADRDAERFVNNLRRKNFFGNAESENFPVVPIETMRELSLMETGLPSASVILTAFLLTLVFAAGRQPPKIKRQIKPTKARVYI